MAELLERVQRVVVETSAGPTRACMLESAKPKSTHQKAVSPFVATEHFRRGGAESLSSHLRVRFWSLSAGIGGAHVRRDGTVCDVCRRLIATQGCIVLTEFRCRLVALGLLPESLALSFFLLQRDTRGFEVFRSHLRGSGFRTTSNVG